MKNNFNKNQKGFTLIELMVSISVFMMIMLVAMSSLFVALDTSKKARALRYAMDNVNFAMDSMSRSLRMGTDYSGSSSGDDSMTFKSQEGENVYYGLKNINGKGVVERCYGGSECADMTSGDVDIKELKFVVNNNLQSKVYIYLKGVVSTTDGKDVSFSIQTLASQRNFFN